MSHQFKSLVLCVGLISSQVIAARFAIVAGNNTGSQNRSKLWFAEADADRFSKALLELGEFAEPNVGLIKGEKLASVVEQFAETEKAIVASHAAGERTLLVFYFSGHAGSEGLELGGETLPFAQLRQLVEASSADVKVAIVDACESGALTQVKGAKADPKLDFLLPSENSARAWPILRQRPWVNRLKNQLNWAEVFSPFISKPHCAALVIPMEMEKSRWPKRFNTPLRARLPEPASPL
jgi:hypothetical protein